MATGSLAAGRLSRRRGRTAAALLLVLAAICGLGADLSSGVRGGGGGRLPSARALQIGTTEPFRPTRPRRRPPSLLAPPTAGLGAEALRGGGGGESLKERSDGAGSAGRGAAVVVRRRDLLRKAAGGLSLVALPTTTIAPPPARGTTTETKTTPPRRALPLAERRVTIPLEYTGESYVLYYRVDGYLFRAVVDTGSPFLLVPGNCEARTRARWGCYRNDGRVGAPSGLEDTYELFDGVEGEVEWRAARRFSFVNATGSLPGPGPGDRPLVFGVESDSLLRGPGGVFFGLVRDTDDWIRPSFLGQAGVQSFEIDLASSPRTLTLSTASVPVVGRWRRRGGSAGAIVDVRNDDDAVQLVSDLRSFGDPTLHYTAVAASLTANGAPLAASNGRPVYVIFDTGVTGMTVSRDLFEERYAAARARREKSLWGEVRVAFRTRRGKVALTATKPLTTIAETPSWKGFDGHLVVVGLAFMEGSRIVVDIDRKKLWIDRGLEVGTA